MKLFGKKLSSSLVWDDKHPRLAARYRNFRKANLFHIQGSTWTAWSLKMGHRVRPETSVTNRRRVTSQKSYGLNYTAEEA